VEAQSAAAALAPGVLLRALLAGALTGLVGGAYRLLLDGIEPWRARVVAEHGSAWVFWLALAGLFVAGTVLARWLTVRVAPEAAGSGIPVVEEALERGTPLRWLRVLPAKFVGGALALASGLSLGREGPTVHMGAAVAAMLGDREAAPVRRALLAAGAGAGLTTAFSAPLAGLVFILEELRESPTALTTSAALCAVLAAHAVVVALLGGGPLFALPPTPTPALAVAPLFLALGAAAGLVGVAFNRGLLAALDRFERWPWTWGAAAVGVVATAVMCWLPEASGSGELTVAAALGGRLGASLVVLAALLCVKLAFTLVSYGCGVPGGIFAPQLALGAMLGAIVHALAPDVGATLPALATAGMAAVFTASVRAPATGLVLVVELTHGGHLLVAQATATLAAYVVATMLRDPPVYEALRERTNRD